MDHAVSTQEIPFIQYAPPEVQLQALARFVEGGMRGDQAPPAVVPLSSVPRPEGIFDPAALSEELEARSEHYTMPNGQGLWVHPCSLGEVGWLNQRAMLSVRELGLLPDDPREALRKRDQAEVEIKVHGQLWQVIACCRQGPKITDPKVFLDPERDGPALRAAHGYVEAVQQIAAMSDRLSGGRSETQALKEAMRDFTVRLASWLATLCSQLSTDTLESSRADLEAFASCVSSTSQPETLSAESLALLLAE